MFTSSQFVIAHWIVLFVRASAWDLRHIASQKTGMQQAMCFILYRIIVKSTQAGCVSYCTKSALSFSLSVNLCPWSAAMRSMMGSHSHLEHRNAAQRTSACSALFHDAFVKTFKLFNLFFDSALVISFSGRFVASSFVIQQQFSFLLACGLIFR